MSKSPAVFDMKKLEVMSGRYLRALDPEQFADELVGYLDATGYLADRGPDAVDIARSARTLALENFGLSALYNLVAAPAAMLGLINPFIAALAMSGSSLVVTLNALRTGARR